MNAGENERTKTIYDPLRILKFDIDSIENRDRESSSSLHLTSNQRQKDANKTSMNGLIDSNIGYSASCDTNDKVAEIDKLSFSPTVIPSFGTNSSSLEVQGKIPIDSNNNNDYRRVNRPSSIHMPLLEEGKNAKSTSNSESPTKPMMPSPHPGIPKLILDNVSKSVVRVNNRMSLHTQIHKYFCTQIFGYILCVC